MNRFVLSLLALLLALSPMAAGEGSGMPADAFIARTGIVADAAMREKIETFLEERYITAQVLDMIDDERLARYARHLSEDLPIAYPDLTDGPSRPMPEGAEMRQLAVLQPQGAAMESLLVDFERGLVYYDETYPVPEDVCRAQFAGVLSEGNAAALRALLDGMPMEDQLGTLSGPEFAAVRVAVAWEGGVTRCTAAGDGVSEVFLTAVRALLDAGRAAAQGDDL